MFHEIFENLKTGHFRHTYRGPFEGAAVKRSYEMMSKERDKNLGFPTSRLISSQIDLKFQKLLKN